MGGNQAPNPDPAALDTFSARSARVSPQLRRTRGLASVSFPQMRQLGLALFL